MFRKKSTYKTVRIKLSLDSGFSNKPCDKKRKHGTPEINAKLSKSKNTNC